MSLCNNSTKLVKDMLNCLLENGMKVTIEASSTSTINNATISQHQAKSNRGSGWLHSIFWFHLMGILLFAIAYTCVCITLYSIHMKRQRGDWKPKMMDNAMN